MPMTGAHMSNIGKISRLVIRDKKYARVGISPTRATKGMSTDKLLPTTCIAPGRGYASQSRSPPQRINNTAHVKPTGAYCSQLNCGKLESTRSMVTEVGAHIGTPQNPRSVAVSILFLRIPASL